MDSSHRAAALLLAVLAVLAVIGCGDEAAAPIHVPPAIEEACPPGTVPLEEGGCREAGVPPERCATGFEADGEGGCRAILPDLPCGPGELAVPGDTVCAPVAACGSGPWGDIPLEPDSQHVDASYAGLDSDGSADKPWQTIQQAVDAAAQDGLVAVAEGVYQEDVLVTGKAVRLWGRCPSKVVIEGIGSYFWALSLETGSSGSLVRGLAIRGPVDALLVTGATGVMLEELWIHDTGEWGLNVQASFGPTEVTLTRSLIESTNQLGVFVDEAQLHVHESAIVDVGVVGSQTAGALVQNLGHLSLAQSLLARSPTFAVRSVGATLTMQGVLLRDQRPTDEPPSGIGVFTHIDDGTPSQALVEGCVIEGALGPSIQVMGSDATVEATVVQSARTAGDGTSGLGLVASQFTVTPVAASIQVRDSLFRDLEEGGIVALGADLLVEATALRDMRASATGLRGFGVSAQVHQGLRLPARATVRHSVVERARTIGLLVAGSEALVEHSRIGDTLSQSSDARLGHGVHAQHDSASALDASLDLLDVTIERSREFGLVSEHTPLTAERVTVRDTLVSDADGSFGDGIALLSSMGTPSTLLSMRIEGSARAGIASFGSKASLGSSVIECNMLALVAEPNFDAPGSIESLGGNDCGCGETRTSCKAFSAGLDPPAPLEPAAGSR
jgi:hypothetical protein